MNYEELTKRIKENIDKEYAKRRKDIATADARSEAQQKAIDEKKREMRTVRRLGGGKKIAEAILSPSTDFDYGFNDSTQPIDETRCMGPVRCTKCKRHFGYCAEEEEKKKMLPTGDQTTETGTKRRAGGMDFLKNEDLSKTPKEAKILGVRLDPENRFGPRVNIKLAIDGKIKFWGVPTSKSKSPNYRLLLDKFGADENDWMDKRILILLEQDEFSGNWFPRVDFPPEPKKNSRG